MALVKCWDADGKEKMKEPVDARECVENCGFTMEGPAGKESPVVEEKSEEVKEEKAVETPTVKKRGRKPNRG